MSAREAMAAKMARSGAIDDSGGGNSDSDEVGSDVLTPTSVATTAAAVPSDVVEDTAANVPMVSSDNDRRSRSAAALPPAVVPTQVQLQSHKDDVSATVYSPEINTECRHIIKYPPLTRADER